MPFVTEEVWSWFAAGSIHRASWPVAGRLRLPDGDSLVFEATGEVLAAVRKTKSEQKRSLMTPVAKVVVHDTPERLAALRRAEPDLCEAGKIATLATAEAGAAAGRGRARAARRRVSFPGGLSPQAWLEAHVNLETGVGVPAPTRERGAPTLERIGTLLQYLGSPQLEFPAIHLTGTNGKTSTTRMIAELLSTSGHSVGRVHESASQRVNERIVRNDEPISDSELDEQLRVVSLVEQELGLDPSYFEVVTGAAIVVRRCCGRRRGRGSRARRNVGCDQRDRRRSRGGHQREHRPRAVPRRYRRADRDEKRHRQDR